MKLKNIGIAHVVSFYLTQIPAILIWISLGQEWQNIDVGVCVILCLTFLIHWVLSLIAMVKVIRTQKQVKQDPDKLQELYGCMLLVKVGMIPFFILNYVIYIILYMMFSIFPPANLIVALIGVCITFCFLVMTSLYSVSALCCACKYKYLTKWKCVLLVISQYLFVLDVVAVIFAYGRFRKKYKGI